MLQLVSNFVTVSSPSNLPHVISHSSPKSLTLLKGVAVGRGLGRHQGRGGKSQSSSGEGLGKHFGDLIIR